MKDRYEFVAIFQYEKEKVKIYFPDLPGCIVYAKNTNEGIKNAKEILGNVLYDMEEEKEKIPTPTTLEKIECKKNEKTLLIDVWMPIVRNELQEQSIKKTLTIPRWLNKIAEEKKVNFSKLLQSALKDYLNVKKE